MQLGVMPIIFAQAIMFIPVTLVGYSTEQTGFFGALTDLYGFRTMLSTS